MNKARQYYQNPVSYSSQKNPRVSNSRLLQYNFSNRTSPFRGRVSNQQNSQQVVSTSTRTSPTMVMRNAKSDLNSKFASKRINSATRGNLALSKRGSRGLTDARSGILKKYFKSGQKSQNKDPVTIGAYNRVETKKFGSGLQNKDKKKFFKMGNQNIHTKVESVFKNKKETREKRITIQGNYGMKKNIPEKKSSSGNLESLLTAHEKILSKALKIGKYDSQQVGEIKKIEKESRKSFKKEIDLSSHLNYRTQEHNPNSKKSLISNIRRSILSRKGVYSAKEISRKNDKNENNQENFKTQVYSNLQIVNSNIYFPMMKNSDSNSKITPIRVERRYVDEEPIRVDGGKKKNEIIHEVRETEREDDQEEVGDEKIVEGDDGKIFLEEKNFEKKNFEKKNFEKKNLNLKYEDSLSILKEKVEEIKSAILSDNVKKIDLIEMGKKVDIITGNEDKKEPLEKERRKIKYSKSQKKIEKKIFDEEILKKKEKKHAQEDKARKRKKKKKRKRKFSKGGENNQLVFAKATPKPQNSTRKREKKSKFLEASASRELNKFDLSLLENADMEYDSMLLGRRKKRKHIGQKNFRSLQKNPKPRFKNFKDKKNYSNLYKRNKEKLKSKNEKNSDFLKLLEGDSEEEEDIENVKFEVSSVCSDIVGFQPDNDKNDKKKKKKGYAELTRIKEKIKKKTKNESFILPKRGKKKKRKKKLKTDRNLKSKNSALSRRTSKNQKEDLSTTMYSNIDSSKKLFQNTLRSGTGNKKLKKNLLSKPEKKIDDLLQKFKTKGFDSPSRTKISKKMAISFEQTREKNWFGTKPKNHDSSFASATYEADLSQFNTKHKKSVKSSDKGSFLEPVLDQKKREDFQKQMSSVKDKKEKRGGYYTPESLTSAKLSLKSSQITDSTKKFNSVKNYRKGVSRKSLTRRTKNLKNSMHKGKLPKFNSLYYIDKLIESFENKVSVNGPTPLVGDKVKKGKFEKEVTFYDHFIQSTQSIIYIQNTEKPGEDRLLEKKVYLPPQSNKEKKTLIFDLDETLIHCNDNSEAPCDIKVPIKFTGGDIVEAGLVIRPYAVEALRELSKYFEIVIFTASHACYANIVLNLLDPENKYITFRLFREHCFKTKEGIFIKDLRVFANRKMKDLIIIDNAFYSYGFQLFNGIPILPFYSNKMDNELEDLVDFLKVIKDVYDVRAVFKKVFMGEIYRKYANRPEILSQMIMNQRKKV